MGSSGNKMKESMNCKQIFLINFFLYVDSQWLQIKGTAPKKTKKLNFKIASNLNEVATKFNGLSIMVEVDVFILLL